MANKQVSEGRKANLLCGYGGWWCWGSCCFASFFVDVFLSNFGSFAPDIPSKMAGAAARAAIGIGLIFVGSLISRNRPLGAAGSGVILDPGEGRGKTWSRWRGMAGRVIGTGLG